MDDVLDLDDLARRYLDLCQNQMTISINDPAVAEMLARSYVMTTGGLRALLESAAALFAGMQNASDIKARERDYEEQPDSARSESVLSTVGDPDGDADWLKKRIAALEGRIAGLESALASKNRTIHPRARRRR